MKVYSVLQTAGDTDDPAKDRPVEKMRDSAATVNYRFANQVIKLSIVYVDLQSDHSLFQRLPEECRRYQRAAEDVQT